MKSHIFFSCLFYYLLSAGPAFSQSRSDQFDQTKYPLYHKKFPSFSATTIYGDSIDSNELKGKYLFINFWYAGCYPCMSEIGDLNKLYQYYKDSVIFISIARNSRNHLLQFSDTAKSNLMYNRLRRMVKSDVPEYPVVAVCDSEYNAEEGIVGVDCNSSWISRYSVIGFPTTFFIDREGIVQRIKIGAPDPDKTQNSAFNEYQLLIRDLLRK